MRRPSPGVYLLDGHAVEGHVLRGGFVGAADVVDLVRLGQDDVVVLQHDCVCVGARLQGSGNNSCGVHIRAL